MQSNLRTNAVCNHRCSLLKTIPGPTSRDRHRVCSESAGGWAQVVRAPPRLLCAPRAGPRCPHERPGRPVDPVRRHGRCARPPGHPAARGAGGRAAGAVRAAAPAGRHLPAQEAALGWLFVHRGPPVGPGAPARGQRQGARAGERPAPRGSPRPPGLDSPTTPPRDGNEFLSSAPFPHPPPPHARYPPQNTWSGSRAPIRRPPAGPGVDFGLLRAGSCSSLGE